MKKNNEKEIKKWDLSRYYNYIPYVICIVLAILFLCVKIAKPLSPGKIDIITTSTLTDAIDVAELSTAQFTYNGIAELHNNNCYIRYNAVVRAGIDFSDIAFEIDHERKLVIPHLPSISITTNNVDEKSFSFLPENSNIDLKIALQTCQADALSEAMDSMELLKIAEENAKSTVEALLLPIIKSQGYEIIWE